MSVWSVRVSLTVSTKTRHVPAPGFMRFAAHGSSIVVAMTRLLPLALVLASTLVVKAQAPPLDRAARQWVDATLKSSRSSSSRAR